MYELAEEATKSFPLFCCFSAATEEGGEELSARTVECLMES